MGTTHHGRRFLAHPALIASLVIAMIAACVDRTDEEREAEREGLREERARQARAHRAQEDFHRRWHEQYRREIARATGQPSPDASFSAASSSSPRPPGTASVASPPDLPQPATLCDPWKELETRTRSAHHLASFRDAVRRTLDPQGVGLVTLDGRPHQRFLFALRMHPGDEPALGRRPSREELTLDLRWVPLCQEGPAVIHSQTLRFRLQRQRPSSRLGLQLRLPGRIDTPLSPGLPVEILLDPTEPRLSLRMSSAPDRSRERPNPRTPSPTVGLWEITDAQVPDRPRIAHLEMDTSAFLDRLTPIAVVEVPCRSSQERCRFLTRRDRRQEVVMELPALLRAAAPLTKDTEIRQIWEVLRALKFPRCSGGAYRDGATAHPCLTALGIANTEPCQYWLAMRGHVTRLFLQKTGESFHARQTLACPGPKDRILSVEAIFQRNGDLRLRETDLTSRATDLEAELERMTR